MNATRTLKSLTAAALTAALVLTPAVQAAPGQSSGDESTNTDTQIQTPVFSDTQGHWAEDVIAKWSQEYSVIGGYEDGTFRPDNSITRGAFAGILNRFLRYREASPASTFPDTAGNFWEDDILRLNAAGVYYGNNGRALPGDSISRQEAVTMLARAFRLEPTVTDWPYTDSGDISDYARGAIAEMSARGWITDARDGNFRPRDPITRAEFLNILDQMVQVLADKTMAYSQDVQGNVLINAQDGAYLSDMTIAGDLILAPGVTGNVTLSNVTVLGTIRNFSAVNPVSVTPSPEEGEGPGIIVVPIEPADPETPAAGVQPSEVYTPSATTGEYITYGDRSIPVYAGRAASTFQPEDFQWNEDFTRLIYVGDEYETRFGIDVSSYQNRASEGETIDWEAAAADGVDFAMVRIGLRGYGSGLVVEDNYYRKNIQGALNAGIETGVYFFAQAITVEEAIEEADFVIEHLQGLDIDGPVAYDWEMHDSTYRVYGTPPEMATACAIAFCKRVEEAGYTPMIYGGQYVSYVKYDQGAIAPYLSWYPEYKRETSEKLSPNFYYHMDYWQFTDSCYIDGIGGRVDASLRFI